MRPARGGGIPDTDFDGYWVPMTSADLLREYRWAIAAALIGLFLVSRYIMRRQRVRREAQQKLAAAPDEIQLVTPDGYRRARKRFLMTLALLIVIIAAAAVTRFR